MDRGTVEPAEILDAAITLNQQVRLASTIDVDSETLAFVDHALDACRDSIEAFFGITLTGREGAGFLRYQLGGFYRPHSDHGVVDSWPAAARRRVSVVVFLNGSCDTPRGDEFRGGVLRLLNDAPEDIVPQAGCLVAFPADTLHEVTPVTAGTRDVIVDWFY
jgi:predicted 2-oxoglutarate/Fe(II)-dependent dioxygenase YbiX